MIPKISAITLVINVVLTLAVPIGLVIYLFRKNANSRAPIYIGAYAFVVCNALLAKYFTPFLLALLGINLNVSFTPALSLTLEAAFITFGIYLCYKLLLKDKTGFYSGVTFGIGYSGSMLIVFGGYKAFDTLLAVLLSGFGKNIDIEKAEIAKRLKDIASTPSADFLWIGVIAFLFAFLEIALALGVLYAIRTKKFKFVYYVFAVRVVILILQYYISKLGFVASFIFALVIATASSYAIVKSEKLFIDKDAKKKKRK